MANYPGRRAPNVSQYINSLNTIPSAADMAAQQDFSNFDDDLSLFTNTQFFDFDMADNVAPNPNKPMNFVNQPPMPFNEFSFAHGQAPSIAGASPHSMPNSPPNGLPFANGAQQSNPTVPTAAHFAQHQFQQSPQTGDKRTSSAASLPAPQDLEEVSRVAAEEDKRRRNTAASARFRVKKKQREQALEKNAKEMSDKVQILEARVGQLEMENKWLKGLITQKNVSSTTSKHAATATAAAAKKVEPVKTKETEDAEENQVNLPSVEKSEEDDDDEESIADSAEDLDRSLAEKKRGVGTESAPVVEA